MKDLITQARAVEARFLTHKHWDPEAADTISSLCTALEAAQKDAERYRWLRDEAFNSFIVENMTVYPRHGLDAEIDAAIKAQGDAE